MNKFIGIFLAILFVGACDNAPVKREVYSILIDATDSSITRPNIVEILNYIDLKNMDKEILIRISELSEVDYMPVTQLHFKPEKGLLSNQVNEKQKEKRFKKALEEFFIRNDSLPPSEFSNIFDPVCNELKYLSELKGFDSKQLLVYSDLKENNSHWMSFYQKSTRRKLLKQDNDLQEVFVKRIPKIEDNQVQIKVIHIPNGQQENVEFSAIRRLYMAVFSVADISISFSGNLVKTIP